MGVKDRKARNFQLREQEILDTAYELFTCHHPATVTIEQIAKNCEIGRGTLYLHFKNKDDIYGKIIIRRNSQLLEIFSRLDQNIDSENLLEHIVEAYISFCLDDAAGYRVQKLCDQLLIKENLTAEILAELEELRSARINLLSNGIQRAIDLGLLPPYEPILLLSAAWGMLYGAIDIILQGHFRIEVKDKAKYLTLIRESFKRAFLQGTVKQEG